MIRLLDLLEEERRKLNQLGEASLKHLIPLSDNPEVQEQSRRVDELVARFDDMTARRKSDCTIIMKYERYGAEEMEFPPWFQKAIQLRLDEVSAQIEHDFKLSQIRGETVEAFEALFAGKDVVRMPEYAEWENRHIIKMGIQNELLYMQGLRDGIQLTVSILSQSMGPDGESERSNTHKAQRA